MHLLSGDVKRALGSYRTAELFEELYRAADVPDPLSRIQYIDFKTYLPDDILTKVDRVSMANSLEVRCPLLDHHLVEYVAGLPSRFKLRGRRTKLILKEAVRGLVPEEILRRPKMGFAMPLGTWLRKELRPVVRDHVLTTGTRSRSVRFGSRSKVVARARVWHTGSHERAMEPSGFQSLVRFVRARPHCHPAREPLVLMGASIRTAAPLMTPIRVLHVLDHSLPHITGYSIRSQLCVGCTAGMGGRAAGPHLPETRACRPPRGDRWHPVLADASGSSGACRPLASTARVIADAPAPQRGSPKSQTSTSLSS